MAKKYYYPTRSGYALFLTLLLLQLLVPSFWFLDVNAMAQRKETSTVMMRRVKLGAVLDLGSGTVGKMGLSCIRMSLSDFYRSHSQFKTRLQLTVRDSQSDVVAAAAQALDLIKNEKVQAIMGPVTTMEATFVISLGDKAHVPIVTFSATSPSLSSLQSPYFFQVAQSDSTQVKAITDLAQAFGWKEVVPIYVDNSYGEGVIPCLTNSLQQAYVRVPYLSVIPLSATDEAIAAELYKLMTMQTRVFVVHMTPSLGSRVFTIAKQIGMMGQGYVWIVTNGMANCFNSLESSVMESMEGVLGVRPYVPRTKELDEFKVRWKREFLRENPTLVDTNLNVFGIWAYDATTALAMAVEKVGTTNSGFNVVRNTSSKMPDLENYGISLNGEKLREALSITRFTGLSGEFNVAGGHLQASTLEIVNVIGNGEKRIGFWTPEKGLIRKLQDTNGSTIHSTSKSNLGPIMWPGDMYSAPKGWEIPTNGKKLRVGVPVKDGGGYTEFVKIIHDPSTNSTEVTGFCIDVFKAVLEVLNYALPCEFIPFEKPNANGEMAGTYNELVSQVYHGNFDAAVGDITIIANRSNYVDFTLPFTESGVTMVVPVKDNRKKNAWAFLKPLTWDLWVTIACSFVFIGFVVWVLEHRINNHFRGPPSHQIGTSLWFSLSTMVFAHRERVVSNSGRFVVIVWVFVVQILVQSYTASLTSLLTVEQLRPTITDVHQLLKNRMNVGFLRGSFVEGMLKSMGFQDSQLKIYNSTEECNELFTNGDIAAAFDEVPYVKLFLGNHCSKYAMVGPRFQTGGFGFVFPKGSPLVSDISRAILNVTQGDKMRSIENAWFNGSSCPETNPQVSSNSLGLESFWGLFLIVGVSSLLVLMIFSMTFLYQQRQIILGHNPSTSIWRRIGILLSIFNDKDLNSHTFKKSGKQGTVTESSSPSHHHGIYAVETSPSTHCPPSPSSHTESYFSFYADHGVLSPDAYGYATQGQETHEDTEMKVVHNGTPEAANANIRDTNNSQAA